MAWILDRLQRWGVLPESRWYGSIEGKWRKEGKAYELHVRKQAGAGPRDLI